MTPTIERIFREEFGRVVASLTRRFGDLDVAEEARARRSWSPSSAGRSTVCRPTRAAG
jgi:predicted RNA polymerase sigma factor